MAALFPLAVVVLDFAVRIGLVGVILVRSRGTPAVRLSWLVILLALPGLGLPAYLLFGEVRLGRRRVERHRQIMERINVRDAAYASKARPVAPHIPDDFRQVAFLAESCGGNVPQGGPVFYSLINLFKTVKFTGVMHLICLPV